MPAKVLQEFRADLARLVPEPCVEGRLAATGLLGIIGYFHAGLFQDLHHIKGGLRIKLVHKTWYEQLYRHKKVFLTAIIFNAVIAASSPLWPCLPPMRSSACCWLSTVRMPKMVGIGRVRFSCSTPSVTARHTYSKCGVSPRSTQPRATKACGRSSRYLWISQYARTPKGISKAPGTVITR